MQYVERLLVVTSQTAEAGPAVAKNVWVADPGGGIAAEQTEQTEQTGAPHVSRFLLATTMDGHSLQKSQ